MSFKTTINWLFNDIWCYIAIGCLTKKIVAFQQTVVRIYYVSKLHFQNISLLISACYDPLSLSFFFTRLMFHLLLSAPVIKVSSLVLLGLHFLQIPHLLLQFLIRQLFPFIALGNKEGDMGPFKFLFLLYITFIVFSWKIPSISWLLCNTGKYFLQIVLILGSIVLYCVIKLHKVKKLLLNWLPPSKYFWHQKFFFDFAGFIISGK